MSPGLWRHRWRASLVTAGVILLLLPLDRLVLGAWSTAPLFARLVWTGQIVLHMALRQWLEPRLERAEEVLAGVNGMATGACFLGLVWATGQSHSPYFEMMPCIPLIVALSERGARPALLCGAVCCAGVLGLSFLEGQPLGGLGRALLTASASFFGMYGALKFDQAQQAQHALSLERARRESLEKLTIAENQRAQAEKLATVGRLAASVVHEINNPLAFVRANLDYLSGEVLRQPLPEAARTEIGEVFEETRQGVERIRQIVNDLRGFSHTDGDEPTPCALSEVVTDAARLAGVRLKNVARLTVSLPPGLPGVYVTRRRLAQVVLNLLVNAGDALEEARVRGGEVRVSGHSTGDRVSLLVEDNGPGFAPEVLPRLFESFYTTKGPEKGTGLGLSLSREWVERFGGTLVAENRPEGGARLRLELPRHAPAPAAN